MAKSLQDQIPDKVYQAMMNTDVKAINAKHYEITEQGELRLWKRHY